MEKRPLVFILLLLVISAWFNNTYGQCLPNNLSFPGSQPIYNFACGNNSYQGINGSSPTGSGQTYLWEVSVSGGSYTTIVDGSNNPITSSNLSKNDISSFILATHSNAAGDYRIRRTVTDTSPACTSISAPVFLYYSQSSATLSGGTIAGAATVCSPASGTLTLSGNTGPVLRWESATSTAGPWTPINNITNTLSYTNITSATCYRALVDNICDAVNVGSIDALDKYSPAFCLTVNSVPLITNPVSQGICTGSPFTLSVSVTSVLTPTYQWRKNGVNISGAVSPAYSIANTTSADAGSYDVVVTNSCGSVTSNPASITINPIPVVTAPSNSTVCPGNTVPGSNFTSTPSGATYTWTNSNTAIGLAASGTGNVPAFTASNLTSGPISASITVTPVLNGCTGTPVVYTITVNPSPAAPSVSGLTICSGTTAALTATSPGGTYQWYNASSGGTLLFTGSSYNTPVLTSTTTYYVQTTVNGCTGARTPVTVSVTPIPAAPSASGTTVCSGTAVILTATSPGGTYQWYDASSGGTLLFTGSSYSTSVLTSTTTYYVQTTVNGCTSARTAVTVTVTPLPASPTASGATTCSGTTATLTVSTPGGFYQWYDAATGGNLVATGTSYTTPALTATTIYYVQTTVNGCTSARTAVTATILPIVDPEFQYSTGTYCKSGIAITPAPVIYTSGGGTFSAPPGIVFVNASTGEIDVLASTLGTYTITFINNSPCPRATTANVTITNAPDATFFYLGPFCQQDNNPQPNFPAGSSAGVFSASSPGLVFFNNSTGEINLDTSLPGTYTITNTIAANGGCAAASATYTVTINPAPAMPSVSAAAICTGTTATLTATSPGGFYQWYDSASGGNLLFTGSSYTTPILATNTTYYVQTTVNGCTSTRAAVTVTVNPIPASPVASGATICSGTATILTAISPGGTYQWYNALSGGNLLYTGAAYNTPVLTATTTYYVQAIVNGCISARTAVTVTITPIPPAPSASGITACSGTSATLIATSPGGTYQWYDASSGGNLLFTGSSYITPVLTSTTTYYVQTTINGCTSARTPVTVSITPIPAAPSASGITICSGTIATLTATSPGGIYQWYDASSGGNLLSTGSAYITQSLTASATYYVQALVNGCISARTAVTVTVTPLPAAPTALGATTCSGTTATLTVTAPGGFYQWYDSASGGNLVATGTSYTTPALTATTIYYVQTTVNGCTSARTAVTATILPIVDPEFKYSSGTYCKSGMPVTPAPDIYTSGGGTFSAPPGIVFANASTGQIDVSASALGTYGITFISNSPCPRATSANVTITNFPDATFSYSGPFCQQDNNPQPLFPAGSSAGVFSASSPGLVFFNTSTGEINLDTSLPGTYTIINTIAANGGCAAASAIYSITINPAPASPSVSAAAICTRTAATLTAISPGGIYQWYDSASGGNLLFTGASYTTQVLTVNTTYYVQAIVNGCASARAAVTVTVNPIPASPIASGATICSGTTASLTAISSGGTYQWYDALSGGNLLYTGAAYNTPVLTATTTYYVQVIVNGCSSARTAVTVTITPIPSAPSASGVTICSGTGITLTATSPGGTYQWYDVSSGGNLLFTGSSYITPVLTSTTTYYVQTTINGCTSARTPVTVSVTPIPVMPLITSNSPACIGSSIILNTLRITGAVYFWTGPNGFASNAQNPVINDITAANAGVYKLEVSVNGCTSAQASATVTINVQPLAKAGNDQLLCVTADTIKLNGTVTGGSLTGMWTSSGSGIFSPSNTSLRAVYIPSSGDKSSLKVILSLTSTNNGGCNASVSSLMVTFRPLPIVDAGPDQVVCSDNPAVSLKGFTDASGIIWASSGTGKFLPSNTNLNASYIPGQSDIITGTVKLRLISTGNNLCGSVSDTMKITIVPSTIINAGPDKLLFERSTAIFTPEVSEPDVKYLWTPNVNLSSNTIKNPVVTAVTDQVYTLRVTNKAGCFTEDKVLVKVLKPIVIPNTFTPNGDGVNDVWNISQLSNYPGATVEVFNRYGTKIYESAGYSNPWDGTYKGSRMPDGTYYYIIDTQFPGQVFSGFLTILR